MNLTTEQLAAVRSDAQDILCIAGAGAGKTRVLVARIKHLNEQRSASPSDLMVLSFTRKASGELIERLKAALGDDQEIRGMLVGTFHSVALKILRADGDKLGYDPEHLTVLDQADADTMLEEVAKELGYCSVAAKAKGKVTWSAGLSFDRVAKFRESQYTGQQLTDEWAKAPALFKIFRQYQFKMREFNCLDFGSILMQCNNLLGEFPDVLRRYQERVKFVLVDELQDSDATEYRLHEDFAPPASFFGVGDTRQCIPEGEFINTPSGMRRIEQLKKDDRITTIYRGRAIDGRIKATWSSVQPDIYQFTLDNGTRFRASGKHLCFAAIDDPGGSMLYLMYRPDLGFRIGVSRTAGYNGNHFVVRTQQEEAERIWILEWFADYNTAAEREAHLAYEYGVPREPFKPRKEMWSNQARTETLFRRFGGNGATLLQSFGISFDHPNYFAKASGSGRVVVNLCMCGKSGHEVAVESKSFDAKIAARLGMKPTQNGTFRIRRYFKELCLAEDFAREVADSLGVPIMTHLGNTPNARRMLCVQARSIFIGMRVPVLVDGVVSTARVVAREQHAESKCYDLEVESSGVFAVNGVVVHNSIYGFRGARPDLMIEKHPGAAVFNLRSCFRCGSSIVSAANRLIARNHEPLAEPMVAHESTGKGSVATFHGRSADVMIEAGRVLQRGYAPSDIAILARNHRVLRRLEEAAGEIGVPVYRVGARFDVCETDLFRVKHAAFRYTINRKDQVAEWRIRRVNPNAESHMDFANKFQPVDEFLGMTISEFISNSGGPRDEVDRFWLRNCGAMTIPDALRWYAMLGTQQYQRLDSGEDRPEGGAVTLMTVHAAKGLEFPVVIVAECQEGTFPASRALKETHGEREERRLFYVAATRAKERLLLHFRTPEDMAEDREIKPPSRFIQECSA